MRKLSAFTHVSLDGYFRDLGGDTSWAKHGADEEFDAFTTENARGGGVLLFGRVTYEMMSGFWPTPQAAAMLPTVAERMNALPKVVFSRTLAAPSWNNTTLVGTDAANEIARMKGQPGPGMVILGSGSLVAQLSDAGLVDEYQVVVNPVLLGSGRTPFEGLKHRLPLSLTQSRTSRNGKLFLRYERE
ncbi:MAG: Riboflavin biosynthesis protein ribD [Phycisphaerales bacterium]|nr:Riboflavin biosynthesis protein ribD [Phycisphaerales bacterium]